MGVKFLILQFKYSLISIFTLINLEMMIKDIRNLIANLQIYDFVQTNIIMKDSLKKIVLINFMHTVI